MRLIPSQSSNFAAIAYQPESEYVYAQFKSGWYQYRFESSMLAETAISAVLFAEDSQGKAFHTTFKRNNVMCIFLTPDEVEDLNLHV